MRPAAESERKSGRPNRADVPCKALARAASLADELGQNGKVGGVFAAGRGRFAA